MKHAIRLGLVLLLTVAAACSAPTSEERADTQSDPESEASPAEAKQDRPSKTRSGPFEIVLGEWAVTPEAKAVRPGKITFRIVNRGTMTHGFEIEAADDHSGSGGGEGFKFETRLIEPGDAVKVQLDLPPGTYKIECLVDGHDDRGMEGFLQVRRGAKSGAGPGNPSSDTDIAIEAFNFDPADIEVTSGAEVTWANADPTEHTVTGRGFGSDTLGEGGRFSHRFDRPGTYRYRCAIHPDMTARVRVTG